jgi:hypothetical protein
MEGRAGTFNQNAQQYASRYVYFSSCNSWIFYMSKRLFDDALLWAIREKRA